MAGREKGGNKAAGTEGEEAGRNGGEQVVELAGVEGHSCKPVPLPPVPPPAARKPAVTVAYHGAVACAQQRAVAGGRWQQAAACSKAAASSKAAKRKCRRAHACAMPHAMPVCGGGVRRGAVWCGAVCAAKQRSAVQCRQAARQMRKRCGAVRCGGRLCQRAAGSGARQQRQHAMYACCPKLGGLGSGKAERVRRDR